MCAPVPRAEFPLSHCTYDATIKNAPWVCSADRKGYTQNDDPDTYSNLHQVGALSMLLQ
jgi:hypothetical protein